MVFNTHCASFNRLSLLRCYLSHSRRQRDSATSAVILRLDLTILAYHFPSHFRSLVRVLKERTRISQLSSSFFFVRLFSICSSSSASNLLSDRASECARCSPKLEQSNKQLLVASFSSNFLTFPLLLQKLL